MARGSAWILVIGAYLLVAFAYLLPQDFRSETPAYVFAAWTAFMVRVFLFHMGLAMAAIAAVAACRRRWRLAAAAAPVLLATLGPALWEHRPRNSVPAEGDVVTVMTVNPWHKNLDPDRLLEEVERIAPDVLLVQEYTPHWHEALQRAFGERFPHVACVVRKGPSGCAMYSRRAFVGDVNKFVRLGDTGLPEIRAVIEIGGRQAAVYCLHFTSPQNAARVMVGRRQLADLVDVLSREPLPAIVGGDFNFTEMTPQAAAIARAGFANAFSVGGRGRGSTWPRVGLLRWAPGIRLDHIYLSDKLVCYECFVGGDTGSDHRAVVAEIGLR